MRHSTKRSFFALCCGASVASFALFSQPARAQEATTAKRNVIIFIADGLRGGSVNENDSPAIYSLATSGVWFKYSHSVFPTLTTPNASALATGHYLGDTGDYGNVLYPGFPIFASGLFGKSMGSPTPSIEQDEVLSDIDENFSGNYLTEESLLKIARSQGYETAAVGKVGPALIQDLSQDVAQKQRDPNAVVVDDATGSSAGAPLSPEIVDALKAAGLPLKTPNRRNGASANSQQSNGFTGDNVNPGALAANIQQQKYFADVVAKALLPKFKQDAKPFMMVFWSRDPDGTQHNQGDSLNSLTPGINGPTSKAGILNADSNLAAIREALANDGLADNTDIFVVSDHGFCTISKHEIDSTGDVTHAYSASITYKNASGKQDVNAGFLPPGALGIDIAHELKLSLYDADTMIDGTNGKVYKPVDPTAPQESDEVSQYPEEGNCLIGGTGTVQKKLDASAIIAANGGMDLIYATGEKKEDRQALVEQIAKVLVNLDYVSGFFVDDDYGKIPGSMPLSTIKLKGKTNIPVPAIVVNFRSFALDPANPTQSGILISDHTLQEGQGMHGGFDRSDTFNFMAAFGPDFKSGYTDPAPVGNADVAVTLAHITGLKLSDMDSKITGRVIDEALAGHKDANPKSIKKLELKSAPADNGVQTTIKSVQYRGTIYFDAAGFEGKTNGL